MNRFGAFSQLEEFSAGMSWFVPNFGLHDIQHSRTVIMNLVGVYSKI